MAGLVKKGIDSRSFRLSRKWRAVIRSRKLWGSWIRSEKEAAADPPGRSRRR